MSSETQANESQDPVDLLLVECRGLVANLNRIAVAEAEAAEARAAVAKAVALREQLFGAGSLAEEVLRNPPPLLREMLARIGIDGDKLDSLAKTTTNNVKSGAEAMVGKGMEIINQVGGILSSIRRNPPPAPAKESPPCGPPTEGERK